MTSPNIPRATYRFQFNKDFTFRQAAELVPYLAALGISHCYASPYLRARPGSMHGYDIIDHHHLNPEIGSLEDYEAFVSALHEHGMGQVLDIVPNHMGVMGSDNTWWLDVLENGEASNYADYFDIDWEPLKDELQGKVLLPVLGDQYGTVLDSGELKLTFDKTTGEFSILYFQHRFPVNPKEYPRILRYDMDRLQQQAGADNHDVLELQSLAAAFSHLPGRQENDPEKREERIRDKEINKRRLAALCDHSPLISAFIEANVRRFNGVPGDSSSFEELHELIKAQAYRLAYWRVAADDINYRRFFDVNDLAALRQENPAVFEETHRFVLELVKQGKVNGLRIDHPDGLYDPAQYFHRLQCGQDCPSGKQHCSGKPLYIVIEKILTGTERLPEDWPVYGTTGYDFANLVNALFVDPENKGRMDRVYRTFVGHHIGFEDLVYRCKKLILDRALNSELNVLANSLSRIALANRHTCDFTLKSLRDALAEVAACFPVYRTYVTEHHISESDREYIEQAVACAKDRNTTADVSVYDFIRSVLLTTAREGHTGWYRRAVLRFAMKFQQLTGALMAKGVEDTAFYRYNRLVSLNEVGGDPERFGVSAEEFHREVLDRAKLRPHRMLSTSTHDSKRSEDVRARINVLSEIPVLWRRYVRRWRDLNHGAKVANGSETPSRNDEYLLYQTLVGAWPIGTEDANDEFVTRIREYMLKAVREAKQHTSWANQNAEYETALADFVAAVLRNPEFLADFVPFQQKVAHFGIFNSLSQLLLKLTAPGVPDIYQGNELWDFSLVDPDNRRPVDYAGRIKLLANLHSAADECDKQRAAELMRHMADGQIKLYVSSRTLTVRQQHCELFQDGEYLPLEVTGEKSSNLVAFARKHAGRFALVAAPRLCAKSLWDSVEAPVANVWGDSRIQLPSSVRELRNQFTGEVLNNDNGLSVAGVLRNFPLALLTGTAV